MDEQDSTGWVADRFGVRLHTAADSARPLDSLVGLALRRNPRRAHLLVSAVLGKHVPADPRLIHDTGLALGEAVSGRIDEGDDVTVLGFAETATGLGHCVAEALGASYLHSTRRALPGLPEAGGFEEEHSHATSHRLLPEDPELLRSGGTLVLVDDELSTGRTARNTITALHSACPHRRYVLAALVDLRGTADRAALDAFAHGLGVTVDVVALASGAVEWPPDFPQLAATEVAVRHPLTPHPEQAGSRADVVRVDDAWSDGIRESGRHGMTAAEHDAARAAAGAVAAVLVAGLVGDRVLVLGTEELMYAPILVGVELAARGRDVRMSSTTRSPVLCVDEPRYPIRSVLSFPSHDDAQDGPGRRFAYNVAPSGSLAGGPVPVDGFSDIVVVLDRDSDGPAFTTGLLESLRGCCRRVHTVVLPTDHPPPAPLRGPTFGSYPVDEVAWLLTDLSGVALEAPTEEREEAIQAGGAHYAESLPVEFQPDAAYLRVFEAALEASAERMAHAVGVVTEIVLAERGPRPVLASLARAGTPVGALMRRWAQQRHGLVLPHYAVSIVRGRGIDTAALRFLAAHHDPGDVVFVDGWTGKGAITRELSTAIALANADLGVAFNPALAVLADPGCAAATFGTREDFLVPSACLNSTVSGLVSRTVFNRRLLRPDQFHGAKFYRELAGADVSTRFLDAVTDRFAGVAAAVEQDWPLRRLEDRTPTWAGWAEIERISEQYGIGDATLVKPGVGETTRVLLRRVPWAVLLRAGSTEDADLAHVRLLAEQRGVAIHEVDGLTYRCVGLIHPRFTRGATGAGGRAVAIT